MKDWQDMQHPLIELICKDNWTHKFLVFFFILKYKQNILSILDKIAKVLAKFNGRGGNMHKENHKLIFVRFFL